MINNMQGLAMDNLAMNRVQYTCKGKQGSLTKLSVYNGCPQHRAKAVTQNPASTCS